MLQKELQKHQWKAFTRHSMFERNMGVKIFMFIIFGFLGLQLLSLGFFLEKILLDVGPYTHAIDTFNYIISPLFLFDFTIKYTLKQSNSMQIAPYLTLPVKRNKLFNFLLVKEFTNVWNLYFLFLIVPFAFKTITPYSGFLSALLYILFFYLTCVSISLLVNIAHNLQRKSGWFYALSYMIVAGLFAIYMFTNHYIGDYTVRFGEWIINKNPFVWLILLLVMAGLWKLNQRFMREEVYRELQGKKVKEATNFTNISFLDKLGEKGDFIQMEIKMIFRSKRLKQQMYMLAFFFIFYVSMLLSSETPFHGNYFSQLFFTIFLLGFMGLIMGQYIFTTESSFFDGLMARKHSLLNMLTAKYIFYFSISLFMVLVFMIFVFMGKLDFLFLISTFFYTVGVIYFLMFQNAVYNKSYFDLFDGGAMNWKGTSGNMLVVTLLGMFVPIFLISIIVIFFNMTVACYFMLITGFIFTVTTKYWLRWTYQRFLKRKYLNMEGFRSN